MTTLMIFEGKHGMTCSNRPQKQTNKAGGAGSRETHKITNTWSRKGNFVSAFIVVTSEIIFIENVDMTNPKTS